jgi:hypothetical protein
MSTITPKRGQKYRTGPHRTVIIEHVDRAEVYYAIHDDDSTSPLPDRYRVPIQVWVDTIATEIAAGRVEMVDAS